MPTTRASASTPDSSLLVSRFILFSSHSVLILSSVSSELYSLLLFLSPILFLELPRFVCVLVCLVCVDFGFGSHVELTSASPSSLLVVSTLSTDARRRTHTMLYAIFPYNSAISICYFDNQSAYYLLRIGVKSTSVWLCVTSTTITTDHG